MADSILDRFKEADEVEASVDTGKKVKIGIIGTGWIAEAHVKNYLPTLFPAKPRNSARITELTEYVSIPIISR